MKKTSTYRTMWYCFLTLLLSIFVLPNVNAFVERRYALQEVISESTNIIFGTVTSVDSKRMRAIVKVTDSIKGKSTFEEIKINIAVGQYRGRLTSPKMLTKKLKVGLPIIVFYQQSMGSVDALGHVNGTWFQMRSPGRPKPKMWWSFTHIEVYMHRTYKGSTEDFQKLLLKMLKPFDFAKPGSIKILVLMGNRSVAEFAALSKWDKIANKPLVCQPAQSLELPNLDKVQILWLGYRTVSRRKYPLDASTEERIKNFVRKGGIVIVSGQDTDPKWQCATGFLPEPLVGVEKVAVNGIQPNKAAGNLFKTPNRVSAEQIRVDDMWTQPSPKYNILATGGDGQDVAIATLKYGKGMYIVTALMNGQNAHLKVNKPILENLLYFAIRALK